MKTSKSRGPVNFRELYLILFSKIDCSQERQDEKLFL